MWRVRIVREFSLFSPIYSLVCLVRHSRISDRIIIDVHKHLMPPLTATPDTSPKALPPRDSTANFFWGVHIPIPAGQLTSSPDNPPPRHPRPSSRNNRQRRRHIPPLHRRIRHADDDDPPRLPTEAARILSLLEPANLPETVYGGEDETDGGRVYAAEGRDDPGACAEGAPEGLEAKREGETREKDAEVAEESAKWGV